jgi:hypothetical protein
VWATWPANPEESDGDATADWERRIRLLIEWRVVKRKVWNVVKFRGCPFSLLGG